MKKHYVNQDGVYIGLHGAAPRNSIEIPNTITEVERNYLQVVDGVVSVDPVKQTEYEARLASELEAKQAEAKIEAKLKRLRFAERIKAEISVLNDEKFDEPTFQTYLSDPQVQQISLLLNDGALQTVRDMLLAVDLSDYYTFDEKDDIIRKLTVYLASE